MGGREWTLLVLLSVLWGGTFFFVEVALRELPPLTLVFCRVSLAALALVLLLHARGLRLPADRATWATFAAMGVLNNLVPFCLIFWGQTRISGGLASILNATTPLWTVVVAHLLTADERLTGHRLAGVALGLAGVVVLIGPGALAGLGTEVWGQVAVVGAALSYAFAGVYGRRFAGRPPLVTAAGQVTATTVMMLPLVLVLDRPWTLAMPGAVTWAAVAGLALASTAVGYVLYFRILAAAGATNLLLVTFLIPVTAILLGALVLGERLDGAQAAGMALIAGGLAAIDGRPLRWLRRDRRVRT
ncbi:MAG: DMT family transporter [Hyphomicrobiales bacterium]|nr:DMT family transporter [Hyphomicrobiales bacterium]